MNQGTPVIFSKLRTTAKKTVAKKLKNNWEFFFYFDEKLYFWSVKSLNFGTNFHKVLRAETV